MRAVKSCLVHSSNRMLKKSTSSALASVKPEIRQVYPFSLRCQ